MSPFKQITYSMERNQCISTSSPVKTNLKRQTKREHVKGRLDFDGSDALMNLGKPTDDQISTSESEKEIDIFDIDLPSLDAIGTDFSFTDMLRDFDLECEEMGYSCQQTLGASTDEASGYFSCFNCYFFPIAVLYSIICIPVIFSDGFFSTSF